MEPRSVDATIASDLRKGFRELYGEPARVYRAPGRVNLIGEHTDYNDGFVMPVAIDLCVWVAIAPRVDRKLLVRSINFPDTAEVDLEAKVPHARNHWSDYVQGVAVILTRAGCRLQGANLLIRGDVPIGAGLSSSAAIEVATALALLDNSELVTDRVELAELCRSAENEFVGARVGIMDQFVSCCAQAGQALFLDCRSLEYWLVPLPPNVSLVTCNTMVKHRHASGEYNTRRAQCEEGVRLLSRSLPNIRALRDVTAEELERHGHDLPETIRKRCRHVILENARVSAASTALQDGDLVTFGRLMKESHRSLRGDYEVSCPELDVMVELAEKQEGVYGARMTGGGFGGCTVNLVKSDAAALFEKSVSVAYEKATGLSPQILVTSAAAGVGEVEA
jgi:galactokinase